MSFSREFPKIHTEFYAIYCSVKLFIILRTPQKTNTATGRLIWLQTRKGYQGRHVDGACVVCI